MIPSAPFLPLVLFAITSALKTSATPTPAVCDVDLLEPQGQLPLGKGSNDDAVQWLPPAESVIDPCATFTDCNACVTRPGNACRWSQITFDCSKPGGTSNDKVLDKKACAFMNQMQQAFPATTVSGRVTKKAGVVPQEYRDRFARIQNHVFNGELNDINSGRHLLTTFQATHPRAHPTSTNNNNHLQEFTTGTSHLKTVWVDGTGPDKYNQLDIQNMCVTADKLLNGGDGGGKVGVVVQSRFSFPACITFSTFRAGPKSCYPIGVFGPPGRGQETAKVGARCKGSLPA